MPFIDRQRQAAQPDMSPQVERMGRACPVLGRGWKPPSYRRGHWFDPSIAHT
jgi:hypothetical protein